MFYMFHSFVSFLAVYFSHIPTMAIIIVLITNHEHSIISGYSRLNLPSLCRLQIL